MIGRSPGRKADPLVAAEGRSPLAAEMLRGTWYVAMVGRHLRPGRMVGKVLLGEPVVIGREINGTVFAVRDACPHRGMPLHFGKFDGTTLQCRYHGWRFGTDGRCVEIPSLIPDQGINLSRIRCQSYKCVEQQGMIWVYVGEPDHPLDQSPGAPPLMTDFAGEALPNADSKLIYNVSIDHAAYSLMDPAHVAFVHRAWWAGKNPRQLLTKEKRFEPCEQGWRTERHPAPSRSLIHRLFGPDAATDIELRLPGLRIERVIGRRRQLVHLLAITPIDAETTQMIQCFWWSMRSLDFLGPLVGRMGRRFLSQDVVISSRQREGLRHDPPLMLMADADTQMVWWLKLKAEWLAHRRERRAFVNPLKPATLRYRS